MPSILEFPKGRKWCRPLRRTGHRVGDRWKMQSVASSISFSHDVVTRRSEAVLSSYSTLVQYFVLPWNVLNEGGQIESEKHAILRYTWTYRPTRGIVFTDGMKLMQNLTTNSSVLVLVRI